VINKMIWIAQLSLSCELVSPSPLALGPEPRAARSSEEYLRQRPEPMTVHTSCKICAKPARLKIIQQNTIWKTTSIAMNNVQIQVATGQQMLAINAAVPFAKSAA
jgi:hypothetical protein